MGSFMKHPMRHSSLDSFISHCLSPKRTLYTSAIAPKFLLKRIEGYNLPKIGSLALLSLPMLSLSLGAWNSPGGLYIGHQVRLALVRPLGIVSSWPII